VSLSSPQLNIKIRRIGIDKVVFEDEEVDKDDIDDINGDEDKNADADDEFLVPEDSENHKAASIVLK
jgi:hypothetical protein